MLILELNGASAAWLHGLGLALVVGRLAHAQGLSLSTGVSAGRFAGNILTWSVITIAAIKNVLG
jgi:uncharacterized membrane protein YecN with MAPEG domain